MPTVTNSAYRALSDRQLAIGQVASIATTVGTGAVTCGSLLTEVLSRSQMLVATNTHASATVYVGYLSSMTAAAGWQYKLVAGDYISLQIDRAMLDLVYILASVAATTLTLTVAD